MSVKSGEVAREGGLYLCEGCGEEATIKRFFKEKDHIRLQPENVEMEPIRSGDVRVLGRVVGVCRKIA